MDKLCNPLKEPMFRQRPGMYLGPQPWLPSLWHYVQGYHMALHDFGLAKPENFLLPAEFHDWVAYLLGFKESTGGWLYMISTLYSDDKEGLDILFQLLDEYETRVERLFAYVDTSNRRYSVGLGEEKIIKPYPSKVILVTYGDYAGFFAKPSEGEHSFPRSGFYPHIDWLETFMGIKRDQLIITDQEEYERILSYDDKS